MPSIQLGSELARLSFLGNSTPSDPLPGDALEPSDALLNFRVLCVRDVEEPQRAYGTGPGRLRPDGPRRGRARFEGSLLVEFVDASHSAVAAAAEAAVARQLCAEGAVSGPVNGVLQALQALQVE